MFPLLEVFGRIALAVAQREHTATAALVRSELAEKSAAGALLAPVVGEGRVGLTRQSGAVTSSGPIQSLASPRVLTVGNDNGLDRAPESIRARTNHSIRTSRSARHLHSVPDAEPRSTRGHNGRD